MKLLGKDKAFAPLLSSQAEAMVKAAKTLATLKDGFDRVAEIAGDIKQIEHEADELAHQLFNKVAAMFVTPLDKEDLSALSSSLDNVTDAIEAAASRIQLYHLTEPRDEFAELTAVLVKVTEATREAIDGMTRKQNAKAFQQTFIEINRLENESDQLYRGALERLFAEPNPDVLLVIKWKEIFERIEMAVDACEDVGNVVETVVVKYG